MTDYDSIWRTQDEIRTVVNAVLGECIWNLSYSERRMTIELELTVTLDDDAIGDLCCQLPSLLITTASVQKARNLHSISDTLLFGGKILKKCKSAFSCYIIIIILTGVNPLYIFIQIVYLNN